MQVSSKQAAIYKVMTRNEVKLSYNKKMAAVFCATLTWILIEQICHVLFSAEHIRVTAQAFLASSDHTTRVS
jgi:hypothetical protein